MTPAAPFRPGPPGLSCRDCWYTLPLDYANPDKDTIRVYVREVVAVGSEQADLPCLVFFQGGPGSGSPRPMGANGWIGRAVRDYRVLLLDQRGTGLSTPITAQTLAAFASPEAQAAYLRHFRADNIVRDAEAIRRARQGDVAWSILGQSYGGFCAMRYLSAAPAGLREVLITGGIPPLRRTADEIYRATYPRVIDKNRLYYARYPQDVVRVREIVAYLDAREVTMPSGGRLTADRFLQLGLLFGMSDGFETVHYLVEEAFVEAGMRREINWNFLVHLEQLQAFDTNPIFSLLHEACYTQGDASNWAAERVRAEFPVFSRDAKGPLLFTGEMIYPWMFDCYPQLKPLKEAARLLAADAEWPMLYDADVLSRNSVPVAAAVYYDDMYVHREFSEETARLVPNMRLWVTNQYEHNGLRADGEAVLDRLLAMLRGRA